MGEFLASPVTPSRKAGRVLLASLLVLEMSGACGPGNGKPAPYVSGVMPGTASPEPTPTPPSPSLMPSWTASLPPVQVDCQAERADEWTRVPPGYDVQVAAKRLGVDAAVVRQGTLVWADCSGGIWAENLAQGVMAYIHGIPARMAINPDCLMGITDVLPEREAAVRHVGGICLPELPGTPA